MVPKYGILWGIYFLLFDELKYEWALVQLYFECQGIWLVSDVEGIIFVLDGVVRIYRVIRLVESIVSEKKHEREITYSTCHDWSYRSRNVSKLKLNLKKFIWLCQKCYTVTNVTSTTLNTTWYINDLKLFMKIDED